MVICRMPVKALRANQLGQAVAMVGIEIVEFRDEIDNIPSSPRELRFNLYFILCTWIGLVNVLCTTPRSSAKLVTIFSIRQPRDLCFELFLSTLRPSFDARLRTTDNIGYAGPHLIIATPSSATLLHALIGDLSHSVCSI